MTMTSRLPEFRIKMEDLTEHGEKTMRCGAIILGREGRPVYQNPLGHTSMPSIRIISMSTAARFICRVQKRRRTEHDLRLGLTGIDAARSLFSAFPFDCISFAGKTFASPNNAKFRFLRKKSKV